MTIYDHVHTDFIQELRLGHAIELWIGALLLEAGLTVWVDPSKEAATPFEGAAFTGQNDIIVDRRFVLEVKSQKSKPWTSVEDYPYPKGALCGGLARWNARPVKPHAFVIVCRETKGIAVAWGAYRELFDTVELPTRMGGMETVLRCPKDLLVPFDVLVAWLKANSRPPLEGQ